MNIKTIILMFIVLLNITIEAAEPVKGKSQDNAVIKLSTEFEKVKEAIDSADNQDIMQALVHVARFKRIEVGNDKNTLELKYRFMLILRISYIAKCESLTKENISCPQFKYPASVKFLNHLSNRPVDPESLKDPNTKREYDNARKDYKAKMKEYLINRNISGIARAQKELFMKEFASNPKKAQINKLSIVMAVVQDQKKRNIWLEEMLKLMK